MALDLTETEVKILEALQENPRISISELIGIAGVSRPTVTKILNSLIENEKILLTSGLNAKTHKCKLAQVGINVSTPEARAQIIDILSQCPKVLNLYRTNASANILVTLCSDDEQSITSTVNCFGDIDRVEIKFSQSLGTPLKDIGIPVHTGDNENTPCGRNCYTCSSYKNDWCAGCYTYSE